MEPPSETCSTAVADCFIEKGSNVPILLRAHRMASDAVKILLTRSFALALVLKSNGLIDHVMLGDKVRDGHTGSTVRPLCPHLRNSAENGAVPRCYTLFYCSKKGGSYHDPPKLDSTLEPLGLRD
ncbi:hypothetical protein FOL47_004053 [Perkinsus chesapeaki]|uniref:Uncharacterized protein n=1 Tax=Perkinsus chesapeaki TaxID=330153 RepID=A0A7J6KLC1_PERCH|nr:hypothetical protein FOL47_004053 [Perkinsus chesapeaki]